MTQNSDANKSVITFYSIKKDLDIAKLSYKDVWKKYVLSKTEGVSCVNIFHIDSSVEDLIKKLQPAIIDKELFEGIRSEYENDAVYMFLNPEVGEPVDGFYIETYLQQAKP